MLSRPLAELLAELDAVQVRGPAQQEIRGLAIDSRAVEAGFLFAAFPGLKTDGHRFIDRALDRGAVAIIHSGEPERYRADRTYVRVAESRRALSRAAAAFHRHPARDLTVFGITGTDGKSTTVGMIHQLLTASGHGAGYLSSVGMNVDGRDRPNPHHTSTPEAHEVHAVLARIRDHGSAAAVVEATSHGLSLRTARLADVDFDVAVLTNVTHEHLEFHGTVEQYREDKANLFRSLKTGASFGVVNADDPHREIFVRAAGGRPVLTYGLDVRSVDLAACRIRADGWGSEFLLCCGSEEIRTRLNLPGRFNVQNALAAILAVSRRLEIPLVRVAEMVPQLTAPQGRLVRVDCGQGFTVLVDFAHTPNAFEQLLSLMRPLTPGRLIVVFGSAGERDVQKRPLQGAVASRYADLVILTDEDPRGEDRMDILNQIAAGCSGPAAVLMEPDRRAALELALGKAGRGDAVLCLGKGHESSIAYADGDLSWDETAVVREILACRG